MTKDKTNHSKDNSNEGGDEKLHTKHLLALEEDQLKMLGEMNGHLNKLTSLKYTFFRGILRGVATAIGATVIAAILFAIASTFIESVDQLPIIGDLVDAFKEIDQIQQNIQN